jgi:hypothetical protein
MTGLALMYGKSGASREFWLLEFFNGLIVQISTLHMMFGSGTSYHVLKSCCYQDQVTIALHSICPSLLVDFN